MDYTATFDVGTTAVKGVLLAADLTVRAQESVGLTTFYEQGRVEQDPRQWYAAFCTICRRFVRTLGAGEQITAVIMSGQMQDTIALDEALRPVGRAILYADSRAEEQAQALKERLQAAEMAAVTGNFLDGSLPLAKLLWLKEQESALYARLAKVVFSSKDYLIACLCHQAVTDLTTAATVGLLDCAHLCWREDYLTEAGLSPAILPRLCRAEQLAGRVSPQAASQCGLASGTAVYAGLGDAGAATLASGIAQAGEISIHLGTSGWVAAISDKVRLSPAVFNLVAADAAYFINVVPFLNAGNVHAWAAKTFAGGDFARLEELTAASAPGAGGVLCLPYLVGERYPVLDGDVRASFLGLSPETTPGDLARAALEGVAFSLRQGLESLGRAKSLSLIGGGAQDSLWCQMLSDVLGQSVRVPAQSDYLSAMTLAAIVQLSRGDIADYPALTARLRARDGGVTYHPSAQQAAYDRIYGRYQRLYPALKAFYQA